MKSQGPTDMTVYFPPHSSSTCPFTRPCIRTSEKVSSSSEPETRRPAQVKSAKENSAGGRVPKADAEDGLDKKKKKKKLKLHFGGYNICR